MSLEDTGGGSLAAKAVASRLPVPGRLNDLSKDGSALLLLTPTAAVVYGLNARSTIAENMNQQELQAESKLDAVSPDGRRQAKATRTGSIRVTPTGAKDDLSRIESEYVPGEGGRYIHRIEFSPDSQWLIVWGLSVGGGIFDTEIYDAGTGRMIFPRFGYGNELVTSEIQHFFPDGKYVELANGQRL